MTNTPTRSGPFAVFTFALMASSCAVDAAGGDEPSEEPTSTTHASALTYRVSPSSWGTIAPNTANYMYAPAFVYDGGRYHYFACEGQAGDVVTYRSATTLTGLASAARKVVLTPAPGETHNCDPAAIKGADGRWYLHYSNTPGGTYTDSGVAVANAPGGPYTKITTNLLGHYTNLSPGQYGRGQTTVTLGPDGSYYLAFTNQIAPYEPNSIVILRSPDPTFANTRSEVTRFDVSLIGGWSTQLSYDPTNNLFVFLEPAGDGFHLTQFNTSWAKVGEQNLPLPAGAHTPGEGQALVTDAFGRVMTTAADAYGFLVVGGATVGPPRGGIPTWVTGPNEFRTYALATVPFVKHGNNGTVSCDTFCQGAQWGQVGRCLSASAASLPCGQVPGFFANGAELTCGCTSFVKHGNNGTVSCDTFCQGAQWGPVAACTWAQASSVPCNQVPGWLSNGSELSCTCGVPTLGP